MTASDLQRNALASTAAVASAMQDPATADYVQTCLQLFFSGLYGMMNMEDSAANDAQLRAGHGCIAARYEAREQLHEDIYVIAYFSENHPGKSDFNNTTVLYCSEY